MKKRRQSSRRSDRGYALLITVIFVGLSLLLIGSVMNWSNSTARQTERNNLYNSAQAAAEAADENLMAHIWADFHVRNLGNVADYQTNCPNQDGWPVTFSFSNGNGVANQTGLSFDGVYTNHFPSPIYQVLGQQYRGLNGWVYNCTASSAAAARNQPYNVSVTVKEQFQLANIPLCQFAIFYNMDMEICPGSSMTVNGPTFVNGTIYADPSQTLTFDGTVQTTASQIMYTNSPGDPQNHVQNPSVVYTDSSSPETNADALVLPIGTNSYQFGNTNFVATNNAASVAAILDLPPNNVDPNSQLGQEYLYNQSDIIISNSPGGTNYAYLQDPMNVHRITPIPYDASEVVPVTVTNGYTTTYVTNYSYNWWQHSWVPSVTTQTTPITSTVYTTNEYYSFATNTSFYDYREGKTVQAVQVNVGALNSWLNGAGSTFNTQLHNDTGHYIDSVYIYNNAPSDSSDLPSVRVANGAVLPSQGLSVVTPQPLYVLGNYNATGSALGTTDTANSAPAALMGDAITILSTAWSDNYNSRTSLGSRIAGDTTVNAATLEGIVQSVTVNGVKHYSGGVENFLRLLEDWDPSRGGQKTLTYNGSIVVMFNSRYATNYWQNPGYYYDVPIRNWGFDAKYSQSQNNLPPIFPSAPVMMRQGWSVN